MVIRDHNLYNVRRVFHALPESLILLPEFHLVRADNNITFISYCVHY